MSDTATVEQTPNLEQQVSGLAALAAADDVRGFMAAREAQLRGEDPPAPAKPAGESVAEPAEPVAGDPPPVDETDEAREAREAAEAEAKASEAGKTLNEAKKRKSRADELRDEIADLTYRKHRAREAAEAEEARILAARAAAAQPVAAEKVVDTFDAGAEPKEEDFPDYRSFVVAVADRAGKIAAHNATQAAEKAFNERLKARDDQTAQQAESQRFAALEQAASDRVKAFAAKNPEYQKRMDAASQNPDFQVPAPMYGFLLHSEINADVAFELAGLPAAEFRRIASLPRDPMLVALGRLEGTILARKASHPAGPTQPRKPVDPAVKPYQPAGTSAVVTGVPSSELAATDPKEFMRQRDLAEQRRRRGGR